MSYYIEINLTWILIIDDMQDEITSVGSEKAKIGVVGRIFFALFFLALAIVITHYKGVLAGIGSGIVFFWWLYQNVFRRQLKTKADVLYEQELKSQRASFKPFIQYIGWFLLVIVEGGGLLYVVTRDAGALIIFVTIVSIVFLFFFYLLRGRLSGKDTITVAMNEVGFACTSGGDISSLHNRIRSLGQDISMGSIFSGNIGGLPARIFDLAYTWENKVGYAMTLLEITNVRNCPNMLIISKDDAFGETISPDRIFPGVSVQLEGNFSEHFSLFVEVGAEDNIRQLLPPDLMAVLIDKLTDFSFLFFDDKLYMVISNNSEHGFLRDYFLEQIGKAQFILGKWAVTLSRMEE